MKMSVGKSSNGGATIRCAALHKEGAPSNGADQSGRSPAGSFITLMRFQAVDNGDNCQRPRRAHQRAAVAFFPRGAWSL